MTEESFQNNFQNKMKKPTKKERRVIQNIARQRKMMKDVWKVPLYFIPALLLFASLTISLSLFSFLFGLIGILAIVKKEIRIKHKTIRGTNAVIIGSFITIFSWAMAVYCFFWLGS
jgi:uncharacterized membrane protein YozB (DUF420 family)